MHPSRLPGQVRGGGARIIPKPPLTGATLLRFPPAAGVGCRMLQAPRKGQQPAWGERQRRTERSSAGAAEPRTLLRSSSLGLGG